MPSLDLSDAKTTPDKIAYWFNELAAARKRESSWRQEARKIVNIYEADATVTSNEPDSRPVQYNILFSNTDTLAPALYNTTPRPEVKRRYKDEDEVAKAASTVTQRILEYHLDDGEQEYSTFDDLMRGSVLDSLVPGRGLTRFKYEANIEGEKGQEKVTYEKVCGEKVAYDRVLFGYAPTWERLPWLAYEHHMTKDEVKKNFPDLKGELNFEGSDLTEGVDGESEGKRDSEDKGERLACIYEIWDKTKKKVFFVSPCFKQDYMKETDDPLGLTGFFPSPKPLQLLHRVSSLLPLPLYKMYEDQARELNIITVRLNKLIAACRIRGAFDNSVKNLDNVLKALDNELLPIDNVAAQANVGAALEKAIWIFPVEKIVGVIQQLYLARQQIKAVIFEITGIADIMRGSSQASETLGAQEIKNQWGTLRLKRTQKEVMRYVRDCLRIIAEISVTKLSQDAVKKMTGVPYPTAEEKQQAEMQLQAMQAEQQALAAQAQQTGQQPPQAPPPPEELTRAASLPTMEEILGLLKDDLLRSYRVDIETNSTVDAEATEDKQNISELLNAMAQFLNGVAPLIEQGMLPFDAAKGMLITIARRFRFGDEVEDQLKMMAAPQPKEDPKVAQDKQKADMELKKFELEQQAKQQDMQFQSQQMQQKSMLDQQKHDLEMEKLAMEKQLAQMEFQMKMAEMQAKFTLQKASADSAMQQTLVNAQTQAQAGQIKNQQLQATADIKNKQMQSQAALKERQMKQQLAQAAQKPKSNNEK